MKALKKALVALLGAVLGCCFFVGCLSTKISVTYVVDGETYRVQEYEMDTQVSLPTPPTKEGHTFIGWYTDEALTVPYAEGTITAGLTLYAKFSVSTVYIVVNTAGGEKIEAIDIASMEENIKYATKFTTADTNNATTLLTKNAVLLLRIL